MQPHMGHCVQYALNAQPIVCKRGSLAAGIRLPVSSGEAVSTYGVQLNYLAVREKNDLGRFCLSHRGGGAQA